MNNICIKRCFGVPNIIYPNQHLPSVKLNDVTSNIIPPALSPTSGRGRNLSTQLLCSSLLHNAAGGGGGDACIHSFIYYQHLHNSEVLHKTFQFDQNYIHMQVQPLFPPGVHYCLYLLVSNIIDLYMKIYSHHSILLQRFIHPTI